MLGSTIVIQKRITLPSKFTDNFRSPSHYRYVVGFIYSFKMTWVRVSAVDVMVCSERLATTQKLHVEFS